VEGGGYELLEGRVEKREKRYRDRGIYKIPEEADGPARFFEDLENLETVKLREHGKTYRIYSEKKKRRPGKKKRLRSIVYGLRKKKTAFWVMKKCQKLEKCYWQNMQTLSERKKRLYT